MCFEMTKSMQKMIATEDIICYKHLKTPTFTERMKLPLKGYAIIRDYCYIIGKRPKTVKLKPQRDPWQYGPNGMSIYEGYHSFIRSTKRNEVNAIFIIPKGAEYYMNRVTGHYVSSDIIFVKWMEGARILDPHSSKSFKITY